MQLELYRGRALRSTYLFYSWLVAQYKYILAQICDLESAQYFTGSDREELFHVNILLYAFV